MLKMSIEAELIRYVVNGPTMGTRWSALFFAPEGIDVAAIRSDLQAAVDQVDNQMSNWKPHSDLNRLNNAPPDEWISLPAELFGVIDAGMDIGALTGHAFDMGVGPAVEAWGFGPSQEMASDAEVQSRRVLASAAYLERDPTRMRVRKHKPMSLDLCGIAKGYGVDRLAETLEAAGLNSYLVGIDGEMRCGEGKPDGQGWAVAVERPDEHMREAGRVLEMEGCAIATSGDYRHVRARDGKRYSHTIDPATGAPLHNGLASVSVISNECMTADALATALMVMGPKKGAEFARAAGLNALFVLRLGEGPLLEEAVGPYFGQW